MREIKGYLTPADGSSSSSSSAVHETQRRGSGDGIQSSQDWVNDEISRSLSLLKVIKKTLRTREISKEMTNT